MSAPVLKVKGSRSVEDGRLSLAKAHQMALVEAHVTHDFRRQSCEILIAKRSR
jgi:hypothetical protein